MSTTVITRTCVIDGVLTDITGMTIGVTRDDTDAVVVATGTAMTNVSTGTYEISFTDPAPGLTYTWNSVATHNGHTHLDSGTAQGGSDTATTTSLYTLDRYIVPDVGGVPDEMLKQAIRQVFADFCRETGAWTTDLTITTVADQATYTIPPVANGVVKAVIDADYEGMGIYVPFTVSNDTKSVTLIRTPSMSGNEIILKVIIYPTLTCDTSPSTIIDQYGYGIAAGVVAWLKGQAKKPWTDYESRPLWVERYDMAVSQAKLDKATERLGASGSPLIGFV